MQTAMLWYDNSKAPLLDKIQGAARYFHQKYSVRPNVCAVNPADMPQPLTIPGMRLYTDRTVQANHLRVGVESEKE